MSVWKAGTDDLGEKIEHRVFFETSPRITRAALAEELFEDPVFAKLDFAVDFGTFPGEIIASKDKLESHIEFIVTVWDGRSSHQLYQIVEPALHTVNQKLVAKYGPFVFGEQPPALPHWH